MSAALRARGAVLIADDEADVRYGLARLLAHHGFSTVTVASGEEALAQLRATPFDALVSDIGMPGNSDLELIERANEVAAGLPVVLLTGQPTVQTAARSVRLAVAAYLTKPVATDELVAVLDQRIADYRAFRAMRTGRERLHAWEKEIEEIERRLRAAPTAPGAAPMGSYLRLTLRQVMLTLADLEQAAAALERPGTGATPLKNVEHEAALRRTVDVLERTKQNFKSRDLAELRKQLEDLLARPE